MTTKEQTNTIEKGFKYNYTAKEKALKEIEQEQKEKDNIKESQEVLLNLGIEVL